MTKTWVLVADNSRARIFLAETRNGPLLEIEALAHPESRLHAQELTSDLPGRAFDSGGQGRHAMELEVEPKQHEVQAFARHISDRLETGREKNQYDQLAVIAAPALLGILRKQLSVNTSRMVIYELDKNISRMSAQDIRKHLPERLPELSR